MATLVGLVELDTIVNTDAREGWDGSKDFSSRSGRLRVDRAEAGVRGGSLQARLLSTCEAGRIERRRWRWGREMGER